MNSTKKCLISFVSGVVFAGAIGYSWATFGERISLPSAQASPTAPETVTPLLAQVEPENTVPVTIYYADSQCETLLPQSVRVPAENTLEGAVGATIDRWNSGDFTLAGYRLSVDDATGIATVDLRVDPNSPRQMISLSSCERFALFGSLTEPLTQNPDWRISSVQFTEKGERISF
ncbi:MAG: sporulation/spore germination protein [Cyanobacteria bacterium J055]|nr:MAG: sporulation/spore germination protein [Cyanobacteria bacterium J055]